MGALDLPDLELRRHRLTVASYMRMGEVGILDADARTELLEGEVIEMAPIGTRHASAVKRLAQQLAHGAAGRGIVAVQDPLHLSEFSMPQPDLMLLAPSDDFYARAHPTAPDVLLLIEVSDTTATLDRRYKLPLYARHGVREVWVLDLDAGALLQCRQPQADASWAEQAESAHPGRVGVSALTGLELDFDAILGPPQG